MGCVDVEWHHNICIPYLLSITHWVIGTWKELNPGIKRGCISKSLDDIEDYILRTDEDTSGTIEDVLYDDRNYDDEDGLYCNDTF